MRYPFYDDFETINVTIKTPIGTKSGSGSIHAKKWIGWICLIPYPGEGEERCDSPKLPNTALENKLKDEMVRSLVGQLDSEEYARYAQGVKERRIAEELRIKQKTAEIDSLIKDGKYEDAIASCKKEEQSSRTPLVWRNLCQSAIKSFNEHISTIDTNRLSVIFGIVDDKIVREQIVVRLNELSAVDVLSTKDIGAIFADASNDEVKICAITGLKSLDALLDIAQGHHSDAVIIAALRQISVPSEIRQRIWVPNMSKQLASCYLSVFDSQEELAAVAARHPDAMSDDILAVVSQKAKSKEVSDAINSISVYRQASKILADVRIMSTRRDGNDKRWKDMRAINGATDKIARLPNCAGRSRAIVEMLKRLNCRLPNCLDDYRDWWRNGRGCFSYAKPLFEMLRQNDLLELIFHICSLDASRPGNFADYGHADDVMLLDSLLGMIKDDAALEELLIKVPWGHVAEGRYTRALKCTLLTCVEGDDLAWRLFNDQKAFLELRDDEGLAYWKIAKKLSKEHLGKLFEQAKLNSLKSLSFEFFYPGMSKRDYIVLCAWHDITPNLNDKHGWNKASVPKISFNRKDRYRIFNTEDDEFWRAFLRKYVPQKKSGGWGDKSRTNWDEDETIHEYTSIEHELKISFSSKTGELMIETWKP